MLPPVACSEERKNGTKERKGSPTLYVQSQGAMEARYLKEQLEAMLGGAEIFLDFDNLHDLGALLQQVKESDVFIVLLSVDVMLRPWCILEIHAAVSTGIPVVGVTLRGRCTGPGASWRSTQR